MKNYDEKFRLKIVQLYNAGKSVSQLCSEFDLKSQTVYAWIKKYNTTEKKKLDANPQLTAVEIEVIELRKKLEDQEMELDILKQAALIMAKRK